MSAKNYQRWSDHVKLTKLVDRILEKDPATIGIDIESGYVGPDRIGKLSLQTFHPDWRLVSFQFTTSKDYAIFVPIGFDAGENIDTVMAARALWRLCRSGKCIAHNASFELQGLSRWFRETLWDDEIFGEEVRAAEGYFLMKSDTMLEAYMLAEFPTIGLKDLTHSVLHEDQAEIETLFPDLKSKSKLRFNTRDSYDPAVIDYSCDDVTTIIQLHDMWWPRINGHLMFKIELRLTPILCRMEKEGMLLDWDKYTHEEVAVAQFRARFNEQIQSHLSERLGETLTVNFASPPQVANLVYDRLGYTVKEKDRTDTGNPGTGEGALRAIAKKDPDIAAILTWREITALLSRYLTKYLKEFRHSADGRAHPNHNQAGAATGRLSVSGVSYQQWPKPYHFELEDGTAYDLNYRDFLIAPEGYRIVGFDFSQVELRILAGMANEQALLKAFYEDVDIHRATASAMMGIPLNEVTKKQRAQGKTLNFAVVYGSGAGNIAEMLGIEKEESQKLLDIYFETFNGLKAWMDSKVVEGRQQGWVETIFKRRYRLWEYTKPESWQQSAGDRLCVNAPVQGGAADYMKIGMTRVDAVLRKAGLLDKVRLVMTIHDALEFYVHESVSTQEVIDLLNPAVSFRIPGHDNFPEIRADWHEGDRWGSVVEIKLDKQKQIVGYALEDVETEFATIEEAYAYQAAHQKKNSAPVIVVPEKTSEAEVGQPQEDDVPMAFVTETPEMQDFSPEFTESMQQQEISEEEPPWLHGKDVVPEDSPDPEEVLLELAEMPTAEAWDEFTSYLSHGPGEHPLRVTTPQGEFVLGHYALATAQEAVKGFRDSLPTLASSGV